MLNSNIKEGLRKEYGIKKQRTARVHELSGTVTRAGMHAEDLKGVKLDGEDGEETYAKRDVYGFKTAPGYDVREKNINPPQAFHGSGVKSGGVAFENVIKTLENAVHSVKGSESHVLEGKEGVHVGVHHAPYNVNTSRDSVSFTKQRSKK